MSLINPLHEGEREMAAANPGDLIKSIQDRFAKNTSRHTGVDWLAVHTRLKASPQKLKAFLEMARSGGEPDVIGLDEKTGEFIFCDRRDDTVFACHHDADLYCADRGFRGRLKI
jgi:Protein of unknown function (DUF4256)